MHFDESKFLLASVLRSALINRQKVVKRALKAALKAEVPRRASDSRNDDFLWLRFFVKRKEGESFGFFSYEKEKNE